MDFPPQRSFRDSHLARLVGIESAEPSFLGDLIADGGAITVLNVEGDDRVAASLQRGIGGDLDHPDLEMLLFAAEADGFPQQFLGTHWTVEVHRIGAAL